MFIYNTENKAKIEMLKFRCQSLIQDSIYTHGKKEV